VNEGNEINILLSHLTE